jgi:prepilin-type N-terminal cleavage/methylation domain-containing protein
VNTMRNRRGFTLIELMIVIGIIAVLVAVLALAVLPWLSKSAENSTRSLLNSVGGMLADEKNVLTLEKFRKDAGQNLSGQIHSDPKKASAQLILFYYAPAKDTWDKSAYFKGQGYNPRVEPKQWAEFTKTDSTAPDLPFLTDGWNNEVYYYYDKAAKIVIVRSWGKDGQPDTDDDLAFDGGSNQVKYWSEMKKAK